MITDTLNRYLMPIIYPTSTTLQYIMLFLVFILVLSLVVTLIMSLSGAEFFSRPARKQQQVVARLAAATKSTR